MMMNIYGHIKKANEILVTHVIFEQEQVSPERVVEGIQQSWKHIEKFIKNTSPDWTNWLNDQLLHMDTEELAFSNDMVKECTRIMERMQVEREVKSYYQQYISLIGSLLIYHKSYEECCDVCQGELQYYTDELRDIVVKKCRTCGMLYTGQTGERIGLVHEINLRRSRKSELVREGII
ncbi:hypothetical protein [Paenibacillus sp. DCT19]|uniref:hypothetical protein n=1 Tax=Paenibacillus sp. DCT19 TaxID=2211212 RepID=UPI000FE1C21A|nr:hypothetical protein [Paenibacillus sp. DCT19]